MPTEIIGVGSAFALFALGDKGFHLDDAHLQTLMYLKLPVAGHLTIFLARTRGPLWSSPRPARILWIAVLGTQAVATLIAVFGIFMTPIGWGSAALVWGYALLWFLFTDRVKLFAYRILDPLPATHPTPGAPSAPDPRPSVDRAGDAGLSEPRATHDGTSTQPAAR